MKITIIEPVCAHGGMDYYDFGLSRGLLNSGHEISLYTSEGGPLALEGIEVKEFFKGIYGKAPKIVKGIKWVWALNKSLLDARRQKADIVHFHFFDTGLREKLSVWLAIKWGHTVTATFHDVESFKKENTNASTSSILSSLDGIIVHNEVSRDEVRRMLKQETENIAVIPHGHYLDYVGKRLEMLEAREHINIPQNCPIFLFFGQIKKVKGLDIALRALSVLVKTAPDAKLVVAGRPWKDDMSYYDALIKEHSLHDNVILRIGYVPQDVVDHYYYACDAVVLPYKRIYQSGVLLMAMSYGKPVIASDLPGMSEIIVNGENGLLFSSEDFNAMAESMLLLIEKPELASKLGQSGRERIRSSNDWGLIGKMTTDFYKTTIGAV